MPSPWARQVAANQSDYPYRPSQEDQMSGIEPRHYGKHEVVRVIMGSSTDILPRVEVLERVGRGMTRKGAPQYRVVRLDDDGRRVGEPFWTSGANVYPDSAEVQRWAGTLREVSETISRELAAIRAAEERVRADWKPVRDAAYAANSEAAGLAMEQSPYRF